MVPPDLLSVIDGRPELLAEIQLQSHELRAYLAQAFTEFLHNPRFLDALPGHLSPDAASQARAAPHLRRLEAIASPA